MGVLLVRTGFTMFQKMSKKPRPRAIALCAFVAMLLINIFALKISSITLMLIGAAVSLLIFLSKGGAKK